MKHNFFKKAVIIHDSLIIKDKVDFSAENKFLWRFEHWYDVEEDEIKLIKLLENSDELLNVHRMKHLWKGCFGVMSVISYDFLTKLDDRYKIFTNLVKFIKTRVYRCALERVFALTFFCEIVRSGDKSFGIEPSIFGDYTVLLKKNADAPIIKIFLSR